MIDIPNNKALLFKSAPDSSYCKDGTVFEIRGANMEWTIVDVAKVIEVLNSIRNVPVHYGTTEFVRAKVDEAITLLNGENPKSQHTEAHNG
jgi:hypothetical protein